LILPIARRFCNSKNDHTNVFFSGHLRTSRGFGCVGDPATGAGAVPVGRGPSEVKGRGFSTAVGVFPCPLFSFLVLVPRPRLVHARHCKRSRLALMFILPAGCFATKCAGWASHAGLAWIPHITAAAKPPPPPKKIEGLNHADCTWFLHACGPVGLCVWAGRT
jgi:hypothetical protein